jgi:hypothetical protein
MGAQQSNLSGPGYDMVCAVTQDSLNMMMRHYVAGLEAGPAGAFSACYRGEGGSTAPTPVADIAALIR